MTRFSLCACLVLLCLACGKSLREEHQDKAYAIAKDTSLPEGEAVGRIAIACEPLRVRDPLVKKSKDGQRTVALFAEALGLTYASSIDAVKKQLLKDLAERS